MALSATNRQFIKTRSIFDHTSRRQCVLIEDGVMISQSTPTRGAQCHMRQMCRPIVCNRPAEYELCCDANIVPMLFQLEGSFKRDIHTPHPFSPKHVQKFCKVICKFYLTSLGLTWVDMIWWPSQCILSISTDDSNMILMLTASDKWVSLSCRGLTPGQLWPSGQPASLSRKLWHYLAHLATQYVRSSIILRSFFLHFNMSIFMLSSIS